MSYKHPTLPHGFRPLLTGLSGPLSRLLPKTIRISVMDALTCSALHRLVRPTNMASDDFCQPIPTPLDASSTRQVDRPPRVMRVTFIPYTRRIYFHIFRMVSGFEFHCPLAQMWLPHMRFLFVGPGLCLQLPSDSGSTRTPLLFSYRFPPSGSEADLHSKSPIRHHT